MKILRINNLLIGILISLSACGDLSEKQPEKPNVLFIICDDLNDYVEGMEGHPQAVTPNIARLASDGMFFTNAYANAYPDAHPHANPFHRARPPTPHAHRFAVVRRWEHSVRPCGTSNGRWWLGPRAIPGTVFAAVSRSYRATSLTLC